MKKYRITTTISEKHRALLQKYVEKFETQQKVLERALECLETNSMMPPASSPEEALWLRIGKEVKTACIIQMDMMKKLMETADIAWFEEYAERLRPVEYVIEYYFQKPLKDCTLKEVMDGSVINARVSNWYDTVNYTDDGDHYTLNITHSLGLNGSRINKMLNESMFRTYGVRTESKISERSVFIKVYKDQ